MERLLKLYQQWKGAEPANIQQLQGAGSNRTYYRLTDQEGQSVIGVIGTSRDEDHAFIYLTEHFNRRKLPVPEILAANIHERTQTFPFTSIPWPWMDKQRAYVQLISKLLGVEIDAIWQRHRRLLIQ